MTAWAGDPFESIGLNVSNVGSKLSITDMDITMNSFARSITSVNSAELYITNTNPLIDRMLSITGVSPLAGNMGIAAVNSGQVEITGMDIEVSNTMAAAVLFNSILSNAIFGGAISGGTSLLIDGGAAGRTMTLSNNNIDFYLWGEGVIDVRNMTINTSDGVFFQVEDADIGVSPFHDMHGYFTNVNATLTHASPVIFDLGLAPANDVHTVEVVIDNSTINAPLNSVLATGGNGNVSFTANDSFLTGTISGVGNSVFNFKDTSWRTQSASSIGTLNVNGGHIDISPTNGINTLTVKHWNATNNPVIRMAASLGGDGSPASRLKITESATGNAVLDIVDTGLGGSPTDEGIKVVDIGFANAAAFTLLGGQVDSGAYVYKLYKGSATPGLDDYSFFLRNQGGGGGGGGGGNTNIFDTINNTPEIMLSVARTGMNNLNLRLGDIRRTPKDLLNGLWVRTYIKKLEIEDNLKTEYSIWGFEAGYDREVAIADNYRVLAGVMGGYLEANNIKTRQTNGGNDGHGKASAPSMGIYGTWLHDEGWFADVTARNFFLDMEMTSYTSSNKAVSYSPKRNQLGLSAEFGKELQYEKIRIEPKAEVQYIYSGSEEVTTNLGSRLYYSPTQSIAGRAAIMLAYAGKNVSPYIEVGYLYELDGQTKINYAGGKHTSDIGGGNVELGGGVNAQVSEQVAIYTNLNYEKGGHMENYGANLGIRYAFGGRAKPQACMTCEPVYVPAVKEKRVVTKTVPQFKFDSYVLTPHAKAELDAFAQKLKEEGYDIIQIEGHTDDLGTDEYNYALSHKRAQAAAEYLNKAHNIPAHKIVTKGHGFKKPMRYNRTQEDRAINRRIELAAETVR